MSKKGSYIGGSTVITISYSAKRMVERQAYWARKLGRDKIKHCVRGVFDTEGPKLIKRSCLTPPQPVRSVEPPAEKKRSRGQKKRPSSVD